MPKTKFQEVVFTILMVFVMVYAMICYNIALNIGGMSNEVFLSAFHELVIMGPAAFVLDFFIVGNLAKKKAFQIVRVGQDNPFHLVLAISVVSVIWMCPLMSLVATLLFKNAGSQIIAVWLETTVLNFPMAFCWQLFFAGPFVRFLFRNICNGCIIIYRRNTKNKMIWQTTTRMISGSCLFFYVIGNSNRIPYYIKGIMCR